MIEIKVGVISSSLEFHNVAYNKFCLLIVSFLVFYEQIKLIKKHNINDFLLFWLLFLCSLMQWVQIFTRFCWLIHKFSNFYCFDQILHSTTAGFLVIYSRYKAFPSLLFVCIYILSVRSFGTGFGAHWYCWTLWSLMCSAKGWSMLFW